MTLADHFFSGPLCKASLDYCIGWVFFILGYCFIISIVLANPVKIDYGPNKKIVEGVLILSGCFLVTIFARCMCYKKRSNEDYLLANDNNEIRFYTETDRI